MSTDTLETFTPTPHEVTVGGKDLAILPIPIRKVSAFAKAVRPIAPRITTGDLMSAVIENDQAMFETVAIATDEDEAWVGDLAQDEFLELARVVFVVNMDFFTRRVLQQMRAAGEEIRAAMLEAVKDLPQMQPSPGDTSLPGSMSAGTGSPTA